MGGTTSTTGEATTTTATTTVATDTATTVTTTDEGTSTTTTGTTSTTAGESSSGKLCVCDPGSTSGCDMGDLLTCTDDCEGFAPVPCPPGQSCFGDACQAKLCEPNQVVCEGLGQTKKCNAQGDGFEPPVEDADGERDDVLLRGWLRGGRRHEGAQPGEELVGAHVRMGHAAAPGGLEEEAQVTPVLGPGSTDEAVMAPALGRP